MFISLPEALLPQNLEHFPMNQEIPQKSRKETRTYYINMGTDLRQT